MSLVKRGVLCYEKLWRIRILFQRDTSFAFHGVLEVVKRIYLFLSKACLDLLQV